ELAEHIPKDPAPLLESTMIRIMPHHFPPYTSREQYRRARGKGERSPKGAVSDPYSGAVRISRDGVIILYLRKNEIVKDGAVVGGFDETHVRRNGSLVGEIRGGAFRHEGVEIWKLDKGNLYQGTEIRWDGAIVGEIRSDGTVWRQGSRWGTVTPHDGTQQAIMRVLAALYYFSDYFQKE
ncbi:MAG: hypothetical protein ACYTG0_43990, partial [Planctomycetota bacterium]